MTTITEPRPHWISIGRNVGDSPMPGDEWARFQLKVHSAIGAASAHGDATVVTDVHGQSSWEGVPEETYLVLISADVSAVVHLITCLANIAANYRQDAIGLVGPHGPTTGLITT